MARGPRLNALAEEIVNDTNSMLVIGFAERKNLPACKLEDLTYVLITVVPLSKKWQRITRDAATETTTFGISIEQRLDLQSGELSLTEDELIELAEDIADWWVNEHKTVTAYSDPDADFNVVCTEVAWDQDEPFDAIVRRENQLFRAIIGLTFRVV